MPRTPRTTHHKTTLALPALLAALAVPALAGNHESGKHDHTGDRAKQQMQTSSADAQRQTRASASEMSADAESPEMAIVEVRRIFLVNLDPDGPKRAFDQAKRQQSMGQNDDAARSLRQASSQTRLEASAASDPKDRDQLNQSADDVDRMAVQIEQGESVDETELDRLSRDTNSALSQARYNNSSQTWASRNSADNYQVTSRTAADDMYAAERYRSNAGINDQSSDDMRNLSRQMTEASRSSGSQQASADSLAEKSRNDFDVRYRRQLTDRPSLDTTTSASPARDSGSMEASSSLDDEQNQRIHTPGSYRDSPATP